jgi:Triosephosphate isomerase
MHASSSFLAILAVVCSYVSAFQTARPSVSLHKSRFDLSMMARKPIIAGNWKMNTDLTSAIQLATDLCEEMKAHDHSKVEVAVIPP